MTTDKGELLELAARAAGMWDPTDPSMGLLKSNGQYWNPLTDDGDCARLEGEVRINLKWLPQAVIALSHDGVIYATEAFLDHNNDRQAARRLASTTAAAEVGRVNWLGKFRQFV